ncbi:MAG: hypothetical protein KAR80_06720 [Rhodospirillaceae bacterium]|nr:hypothetical protein [Rhodospirillaceae bacterium]
MTISLILDVTIAVLLMFTIAYAVRLNTRLSQLRADKAELEMLAKTFVNATTRAEEGVNKLKVSTEGLQVEIKKAEVLKDDLAYLVERGGSTADEMLERVRTTRTFSAPANSGTFSEEDLAGDNINEFTGDFLAAAPKLGPELGPEFGPNLGSELENENPLKDAIKAGRENPSSANSVKNALRARGGASHIDPQADAERVLMKVLGGAG